MQTPNMHVTPTLFMQNTFSCGWGRGGGLLSLVMCTVVLLWESFAFGVEDQDSRESFEQSSRNI